MDTCPINILMHSFSSNDEKIKYGAIVSANITHIKLEICSTPSLTKIPVYYYVY